MILPPVDLSPTAEHALEPTAYSDVRIPYKGIGWTEPAPLASWRLPDAGLCKLEGRHQWDAIATEGPEQYDEDAADDWSAEPAGRQDFVVVLTCGRCGVVETLKGTRDLGRGRHGRMKLSAEQLHAGNLVAEQHAPAGSAGLESWTVYRRGVDGRHHAAGVISWARGSRGRRYFQGRLGDPRHRAEGETVLEGPTVLAVLRRLSRLPVQ